MAITTSIFCDSHYKGNNIIDDISQVMLKNFNQELLCLANNSVV